MLKNNKQPPQKKFVPPIKIHNKLIKIKTVAGKTDLWGNFIITIGPLHDPVTWYGINYTGTQITQWDFQNKGKSGWTGTSSFVLKVPLRNLRPSVIYSVPCDRIVQRAYFDQNGPPWNTAASHSLPLLRANRKE